VFAKQKKKELQYLLLLPCALADASHVRMVCTAHEESGNRVKTQGILKVQVHDN
jgi:hypothetical protein